MKIKRIMLIKPGLRSPHDSFSPSLGLLYLVSVLRQEFPGQFEIDLVEQPLYNLSSDYVEEKMRKFNPDLVGFSCLSLDHDEMTKLAKIAKDINPRCLTVLGGPHASVFYDYVLEKSPIDVVVLGEGEITFPELIRKFQKDEPINQVKGIAFKKGGKITLTEAREPIENLDSLPLPAWDMVDFKRYSRVSNINIYYAALPWARIFTSRGCPFNCAYCHKIFGKRTRFRSPENVIAEIELLTQKYGVKEIQIVDDIFNLDLARAKRICDLIVEKGIKIKIDLPNLRGDMMDRELIHKLKLAGCYSITYAVETASPRLQKLINKNLNLEKVKQAIDWTNDEKISVRGYFMLGFPGETREEIEKTIKWACDSKLLIALFLSVVIYPRVSLMEIAKKTYPDFDFTKWEMSDLRYWVENSFYTKVTGVDLFKIQHKAYRRFYLNPKKLFLLLLRFPWNPASFIYSGWRLLRLFHISLYKIEKYPFYLRKTH